MKKIIYATTEPLTLNTFCRGMLEELSEDYKVVALSSPGEDLDALAQTGGIRTITVPMERRISPWKDLQSLRKMIKVFAEEKPDMVHSMTPKAGLLCMMAARMTGVPLRVHTFTDLVFPTATGMKKRLLMLADRMTSACATHIVPEGEGVKDDLQRYGITRKPMRVLGHGNVRGIDLQHYDRTKEVMEEATAIRHKLGISEDAFVFIFVGRLAGHKGVNELVSAFCQLLCQRGQSLAFSRAQSGVSAGQPFVHPRNIHLLLVGSEEPESDPLAESILEDIEAMRNIHKVGEKDDVRPWYAAADALVFPSHREGLPNVVLEAGAMGLPSIVTDINGSREIIKNGENGVVIPPRDQTALYRAMNDFVDDIGAARRMAEKARPLVASRYEQGYVRKCLKDYYSSLFEAQDRHAGVSI